MSESDEGVSVSVTRQNAGTDLNAAAAPALLAFGGVNAPAAMVSAETTEPFDSCTALIEPHAIGAATAVRGAIATTMAINAAILMSAPATSRSARFDELTVDRESSELYVSARASNRRDRRERGDFLGLLRLLARAWRRDGVIRESPIPNPESPRSARLITVARPWASVV